MASLVVLSVTVMGLMGIIKWGFYSQRTALETLDLSLAHNELANLVDDSFAFGAGYRDPASAIAANPFDPDSSALQPISILDPTGGVAVIYSAFTGDPTTAPAAAKLAQEFVIRGLYLRKKSNPAGSGDIGSAIPATLERLGVVYERRALFVDLVVQLERSARIEGVPSSMERSVAVGIVVERPQAGGVWKVARSSPADGISFNVGWRLPDITSANCSTVNGGNNSQAVCPEGMFIVQQTMFYESSVSVVPCGKSTCTIPINNSNASIQCCKIR